MYAAMTGMLARFMQAKLYPMEQCVFTAEELDQRVREYLSKELL